MTEIRLYMAQRLSAMAMAPLAIAHVGVMIYAVRGGLSAEEILSRTQGSLFWMTFYGLFVLAASIHAAIGVRTIAKEAAGIKGRWLDALAWGFALLALSTGAKAVAAVTWQ